MGTQTQVSPKQITEMTQSIKTLQDHFKSAFGSDWQTYLAKCVIADNPKDYLERQIQKRQSSR